MLLVGKHLFLSKVSQAQRTKMACFPSHVEARPKDKCIHKCIYYLIYIYIYIHIHTYGKRKSERETMIVIVILLEETRRMWKRKRE
jgi:hypothetical protein